MVQEKDRLDLIIKQVFEKMRSATPQPEMCPDDETLAAYLEGSLPKGERDKTEEHLALCEKCTENLISISEAETSSPYPYDGYASPHMVRRAKDLIRPEERDGILSRLSSWFSTFKLLPVMVTAALVLVVGVSIFYRMQTSPELTPEGLASIKLGLIARIPSEMMTRGETPQYREIEVEDGGILHSGDMFRIRFELQKEAYLYLFSRDTQGNLARIFPAHGGEAPPKFKPNELYIIPKDEQWFRLDDNIGRETVYLIASPKAIEDIDRRTEELKKSGMDKIIDVFPSAMVKSFTFKHE